MATAVIIDDERPAVDKLSRMLAEAGVTVCGEFCDGEAALAFLRENSADIVFLDVDMPGANGIELAGRILEMQPGTHIVFVTAYAEYAVEAFALNALDYLLKPVSPERLREAISRLKPAAAAAIAPSTKILCFGRFRVEAGGRELKFRTARAEELLAYFVDSAGRPVHRSRIMDLFWGDYDGDKAAILFNTTLHYLKKAFMDNGLAIRIEHNHGSYSLDMSQFYCDAERFSRWLDALSPVCAENLNTCREAAALYTGDYMEQNEYGWAAQKRAALKERYVGLIMDIARHYRKAADIQGAAEILMTGLSRDPLNRRLNICMLETLRESGDRVSMLRHFEMYRQSLKAEYGMEPDPEFIALTGTSGGFSLY